MVDSRPTVEPSGSDPARAGAGGSLRSWLTVAASHVAATFWLFGDAVFSSRVLYFRDLSSQYAPDFTVAEQGLRQGLWPLWNPLLNAGEPGLLAYPVDLGLLLAAGPRAPIGMGAAVHLLLALVGSTLLARRLGMGPWGALAASSAYGLGGLLLSSVNLLPLYEAAAWAPLVVLAFLGVVQAPTGRRSSLLAVVLALQMSTLALEVVAQTLLVALVIAGRRASARRSLGGLAAAGLVAGLLCAPALLGLRHLIEGTARGRGFAAAEALQFSVHPAVLVEAVVPRLLGNPQAFTDQDFWGRQYFPDGFPYFLSLYLGLGVILMAAQARARGLWLLAFAGAILALGHHGPLQWLPRDSALPVRGPQKLLFLTHAALALLAGLGLERRLAAGPGRVRFVGLLLVPGLALAALALAARVDPLAVWQAGATILPPLGDPRGFVAASRLWPTTFAASASLVLLAGAVLALGGRVAALAAPLAILDLLIVNGGLNPLAPAAFYDLRDDARRLVDAARAGEGASPRCRWFSYGVAHTPGLTFEPIMLRAPSDVWLYYLDRQTLLPRTPALDGLPGAFDIDRTGWSAPDATLPVAEASPEGFAGLYPRLRLAAVRWVLSFRELPRALATPRHVEKLPEVREPLTLYELTTPLPRAFHVSRYEVEADPARVRARLEAPGFDPSRVALLPAPPPDLSGVSGSADREASVEYRPQDAHTVRLAARTPPGLIVVLDGYHRDWTAEEAGRPVPLLRANGRYRAIPTPGGDRVFTMRYRPRWRTPSLIASTLGLVLVVLLFRGPDVLEFTAARARAVLSVTVKAESDRDPDKNQEAGWP